MKAHQTETLLPPIPANSRADKDLREAIRRFNGALTVADLVVATGLPRRSIEEALVRLSREYRSGAAVTESGEVLYSFAERTEADTASSPLGTRILKGIAEGSGAILHGLAKRAPLTFMVGYFVLFLTIPFPPALLLLAILISSWSDMDLLDFYGDPQRSDTARIRSLAGVVGEYLACGGSLAELRRKDEMLSVLSIVRGETGIITLQDILTATGLPPERARKYLDEFLLRFTGEPDVTPGGRVVYRFSDLLRTRGEAHRAARYDTGSGLDATESGSSRRKHAVIALMNFSNILFSVYYGVLAVRTMVTGLSATAGADQAHPGIGVLFDAMYSFAAEAHVAFALPGILVGLGVVPFSVAGLFFIRHFHGEHRKAVARREADGRRLRREVYAQVFASPRGVEPDSIRISDGIARRRDTRKTVRRIVDELAATYHAEIEENGDGHFIYRFPELDAQQAELAAIRRSARDAHYAADRVIFDFWENAR